MVMPGDEHYTGRLPEEEAKNSPLREKSPEAVVPPLKMSPRNLSPRGEVDMKKVRELE